MTPRATFINDVTFAELAAYAWDAMQLASSHDPEHARELKHLASLIQAEVKFQDRQFRDLQTRISTLEHQVEAIGAPQYRLVQKAKIRPRKPGKSA